MSSRLLTVREVAAKLSMSQRWVYKQIRSGGFPAPIRLGFSSRWVEAEVDAWVRTQCRTRDAARSGEFTTHSTLGGAL
jgi:excisionase family DNA binding protein